MVSVPPSLVMRRKNHFHDLPCGATVVLGNNGYIWLCPTAGGEDGGAGTGGYVQNLEVSWRGNGDWEVVVVVVDDCRV